MKPLEYCLLCIFCALIILEISDATAVRKRSKVRKSGVEEGKKVEVGKVFEEKSVQKKKRGRKSWPMGKKQLTKEKTKSVPTIKKPVVKEDKNWIKDMFQSLEDIDNSKMKRSDKKGIDKVDTYGGKLAMQEEAGKLSNKFTPIEKEAKRLMAELAPLQKEADRLTTGFTPMQKEAEKWNKGMTEIQKKVKNWAKGLTPMEKGEQKWANKWAKEADKFSSTIKKEVEKWAKQTEPVGQQTAKSAKQMKKERKKPYSIDKVLKEWRGELTPATKSMSKRWYGSPTSAYDNINSYYDQFQQDQQMIANSPTYSSYSALQGWDGGSGWDGGGFGGYSGGGPYQMDAMSMGGPPVGQSPGWTRLHNFLVTDQSWHKSRK